MKIDQRTKEVTLTEAEYYKLVNSPVSEKLEEAAEKYRKELHNSESDVDDEGYMYECVPSDAFKAGANWQKQQDDEMLTAAYMKGAEEGKEQMMKEMPKWKDNWLGHTKKPCIADEIPGHNGKQLCVAGKCISIDDLWTKLSKED